MARTPLDQRPPLAQWLIRARATQGDDYTADDLLRDLRAATGSAPNPATYRQWESGAVTPKDASLAPVVAFWAARGLAGPVLASPEPERSPVEQLVTELREQNAWMRAYIEQTDNRITVLERLVVELMGSRSAEQAQAQELHESIVAFVRQTSATQSLPPTPDPTRPATAR